jgi:hypothetical protein
MGSMLCVVAYLIFSSLFENIINGENINALRALPLCLVLSAITVYGLFRVFVQYAKPSGKLADIQIFIYMVNCVLFSLFSILENSGLMLYLIVGSMLMLAASEMCKANERKLQNKIDSMLPMPKDKCAEVLEWIQYELISEYMKTVRMNARRLTIGEYDAISMYIDDIKELKRTKEIQYKEAELEKRNKADCEMLYGLFDEKTT